MPEKPHISKNFNDQSDFFSFFAGNLTKDCLFLKTKKTFPERTIVKLSFTSNDVGELLSGEGEVVWAQKHDPENPDVTSGMGIRFLEISEQSLKNLEQFASETSLHYLLSPELLATQARLEEYRAKESTQREPAPKFPPPPPEDSPGFTTEVIGGEDEMQGEFDQGAGGFSDQMESNFVFSDDEEEQGVGEVEDEKDQTFIEGEETVIEEISAADYKDPFAEAKPTQDPFALPDDGIEAEAEEPEEPFSVEAPPEIEEELPEEPPAEDLEDTLTAEAEIEEPFEEEPAETKPSQETGFGGAFETEVFSHDEQVDENEMLFEKDDAVLARDNGDGGDDDDSADFEDYAPPRKKRRVLPLVLIIVVLVIVAGVMAWFVFMKKKGEEAPVATKPTKIAVVDQSTKTAPQTMDVGDDGSNWDPDFQQPATTPSTVKAVTQPTTTVRPQPTTTTVKAQPKPDRQPMAAGPRELVDIFSEEMDGSGYKVTFILSTPIDKFKYFALKGDSPRIVIDLLDAKMGMKDYTVPISSRLVKQVRIGPHPDKVRCVLDLNYGPVPAYTVEQSGSSVVVKMTP